MPPEPLILCIDTTAAHCAVALYGPDDICVSRSAAMTKGQAEALFPMIEAVLADATRKIADIHAIAVATGPGNFTGIRIGVAAARGLALSLGVPAIGVSVLEAMAHGVPGAVDVIVDARGGKRYRQAFADGAPVSEPELVDAGDLQAFAHPLPEVFGAIAAARDWTDVPRPSPLYVRPADAALPSQPMPEIVR